MFVLQILLPASVYPIDARPLFKNIHHHLELDVLILLVKQDNKLPQYAF